MGLLLGLLMPVITFGSIALAVRNGPFENRWWRGETFLGFALTVAWVCFLVGFVGPMIFAPGANQGPLLGVIYTGPLGLVLGVIWGAIRARKRRG
jgi:hypothetical protein